MESVRVLYNYFLLYKQYVGSRLFMVFFLSLLSASVEGFGLMMLMPLMMSLGVTPKEQDISETLQFLQDILIWLGISESLLLILIFIVAIFLLKGLILFAEALYMARLHANLMKEVKIKLFDGYAQMNYKYYVKHNAGHFVNMLTLQTTKHADSFFAYKKLITVYIIASVYFFTSFLLDVKFTLISMSLGVFFLFTFRILSKIVKQISIEKAKEEGIVNKFIIQIFHGYKYLISTGEVGSLRKGLKDSITKLSDQTRTLDIMNGLLASIREPIIIIILLSIIGMQVLFFGGSVATILIVLLILNRALSQLINLQTSWQQFLGCYGSLEKVEGEFSQLIENKSVEGYKKLGMFNRNITFKNVTFKYEEGDEKSRNIINNFSLTITKNQTVAIVGESGSGKSTLVDLMTLILRPLQGGIYIDDIPSKEITVNSWRNQIGYVSQDTVIFDDTIANNIGLWRGQYGSDSEFSKKVELAAKDAAAYAFIDLMPDGFNTVVGDRGIRLSGGQKQRLFIARELFKNPKLLILDEATSALDSKSEKMIKQTIDNLHGKITVVIIAHRLATIKNADNIIVLESGVIVEEGDYISLSKKDNGVFNKMVALQKL